MAFRTTSILIFTILLFWAPRDSRADSEPDFRCAVIVDRSFEDGLPVAHILETDLAARFTMVDRSAIDQLLREREVQALFTPESGSGRTILGKLLKADLLVLLRRATAPGRAIEAIVCETGRGLRLCVQTLPLSPDPQVDAAAVAGWVAEAVPKLREPIRQIVAVPPFVNNDLGYDFDYLKKAYAALVEQLMAGRKGVVAVELAEARAIADEIAVASGAEVARRRPMLFLGEFRHEGAGVNQTVGFKLKLMDGERIVGQLAQAGIAPAGAPQLLEATAARWLDDAMQQSVDLLPDPTAEATHLFDRAAAFEQIGDWDEALALLEAGLLLRNSPDAHRRATIILFRLAKELSVMAGAPDLGAALVRYARQQYGHIEQWARTVTDVNLQNWRGGRLCVYPACSGSDSPQLRRAICDTQRIEIDMALRLVCDRMRAGRSWADLQPLIFLTFRADDEPSDYFSRELDYMRQRTLAPDASVAAYNCAAAHIALAEPGVDQFLKALEALPNPQVAVAVQQAWADARRRITHPAISLQAPAPTSRPQTTARSADVAAGPPEVQFEPLSIKLVDGDGKSLNDHYFMQDCMPAGPGLDVSCSGNRIEVMRTKGCIRRVYDNPRNGQNFGSPCYDGRFVWAPLAMGSTVVVFDPVMDRVQDFSADDGIPANSQYLFATPLGPGSICVAGMIPRSSLPARTWCALLSLDDRGKRVKIFFEARDIADPSQADDGQGVGVAFQPTGLYPVDGEEMGETPGKRYILLGRRNHPLLIDPQTLDVRVCRLRMNGSGGISIGDGNRLGVVGASPTRPAALNIAHLLPQFMATIEKGAATEPLTPLMQLDEATGRVEWGIYRYRASELRRLRGTLPEDRGKVCLSNHYGLLYLGASHAWQIHLLGTDSPPR